MNYLDSYCRFSGGNMRRRATARAQYPTNATYLFRTRPTEQDQARKAISCIARSTSLFALLSLLTTCMMFNINRLWTDTPSSSSSNQTELCFFVLPHLNSCIHRLLLCALFSRLPVLCVFSLGCILPPSATFHPRSHSYRPVHSSTHRSSQP